MTESGANDAVDLSCCTAGDLAKWLWQDRFRDSQQEAAEFLLEAISSLPNAQEISDAMMTGDKKEDKQDDTFKKQALALLGQPVKAQEDDLAIHLSLTNPRGRFAVVFRDKGIEFQGMSSGAVNQDPKLGILLTKESIAQVVAFPLPQDLKTQKIKSPSKSASDADSKKPSLLALVTLKEANDDDSLSVKYKGKQLRQLCWKWPADDDAQTQAVFKHVVDDQDPMTRSGNAWMQLLSQSLHLLSEGTAQGESKLVLHPSVLPETVPTSKSDFCSYQDDQSSSTTSGLPYVSCSNGVQTGVVFPMVQGLLFFKPPLWVPANDLFQHAGDEDDDDDDDDDNAAGGLELSGGGAGRYLTLTIRTPKQIVELTNIHRQELNGLTRYVQMLSSSSGNAVAQEAEEEEEDDQYQNRTKRSRRRANAHARRVIKRQGGQDLDNSSKSQKQEPAEGEEEDADDDFIVDHDDVEENDSDDSEESDDDDEDDEAETESEEEEDSQEPAKKRMRTSPPQHC